MSAWWAPVHEERYSRDFEGVAGVIAESVKMVDSALIYGVVLSTLSTSNADVELFDLPKPLFVRTPDEASGSNPVSKTPRNGVDMHVTLLGQTRDPFSFPIRLCGRPDTIPLCFRSQSSSCEYPDQ